MKRFTKLLLFLLLLSVNGLAQEQIRVGFLPVTVQGEFQPLTSEQATTLLFQGLQDNKPKVQLVLLDRQDSIQTLPQAVELGKSQNLDMVIWGDIRFRKDSYTDKSPSPYYRGRVSLQVATEGDLMAAWIPEEKLVLSQPTIVTSNKKTRSWISDDVRDLSDEQAMAANALKEVADSLVVVLRKRHQAGWMHRP
jgi:hypothetical protein